MGLGKLERLKTKGCHDESQIKWLTHNRHRENDQGCDGDEVHSLRYKYTEGLNNIGRAWAVRRVYTIYCKREHMREIKR